MIKEIWKDVVGYEGLYQISNYGILRSLKDKNGVARIRNLKYQKNTKGYFITRIYKNRTGKTVTIHRLVATAFIPNPHNYPMINHKDEDKTNNCVWNLEWCDAKYNANYGSLSERKKIININHPSKSKPVAMFDNNWELLKVFPSCCEAERQTNISQSLISKVCRQPMGELHAGGKNWRFWEECCPES